MATWLWGCHTDEILTGCAGITTGCSRRYRVPLRNAVETDRYFLANDDSMMRYRSGWQAYVVPSAAWAKVSILDLPSLCAV